MVDPVTFATWLSSGAPALWAILGLAVIWFIRTWPVWKQKITEAKTADDVIAGNQWKRLQGEISRLADRVEALEQECKELRDEHRACLEREANERSLRVQAEATLLGMGIGKNEVQKIVSAQRENRRHGSAGED